MRTYQVLVYGGQCGAPQLHSIAAEDQAGAEAAADGLLADSSQGVGVEVALDGERLYARGVVPIRSWQTPSSAHSKKA